MPTPEETITAALANNPEALEAFAEIQRANAPDPGNPDGGPSGTPTPAQLTQADLKTMTPEAIVRAKEAGQLNDLLGGPR